MTNKGRQPCEIAAEILAALMWGPKCRREVADIVCDRGPKGLQQLHKYFDQFKASGLIYVHDFDQRGREVLALQPKPFERPDADRAQHRQTAGARGPKGWGGKLPRLYPLSDTEQITLVEAARRSGVSYGLLYQRHVVQGLPLAEAMTKPRQKRWNSRP